MREEKRIEEEFSLQGVRKTRLQDVTGESTTEAVPRPSWRRNTFGSNI